MSHQKKTSHDPLADRFSGFQSNTDRKREQRAKYRRDFDGPKAKWMKWGVLPPLKGRQGLMIG